MEWTCDMAGCIYSMCIYLGKVRQRATWMITALHVILKGLTRSTEREGHKLNMHEQFSPLPGYTPI
jgi:hypothetical protein